MNARLSRRGLLAGAAFCGWIPESARGAVKGEPVIDSHVHLFLPEFPYHPQASYRPPAHPLHDYLSFLRQAPIEHVVVVHPEPYQDDHAILEYVFRQEPSPLFFKSTCLFDPIDPQTPERMAALSRRYPGRIVGIRIHEVHKPGTPPSTSGPIKDRDFAHPGMKNLFRQAQALQMAVQFHFIPYYAPRISALAREFPQVSLILDHLARAHEGSAPEVEACWQLAKLPNVYMKYSGPYAGDVQLARRAFDAFGPHRMICGYVGMNAAEFAAWSGNFDRAFGSLPPNERQALRVETARKLFRW